MNDIITSYTTLLGIICTANPSKIIQQDTQMFLRGILKLSILSLQRISFHLNIILIAIYMTYRKVSEISAALGNSTTIINLPNDYWGNSATPDSSKDTFHQKSATK